jgi:outer membrane protein assembly factor BamD (BamD/ComL family)
MIVRHFLSASVLAVLVLGPFAVAREPIDPATDLFQRAQRNILEGRQDQALRKLRIVAQQYAKSPKAPEAQLQIAELYAKNLEFKEGFMASQQLIDKFPASDLFSEAVELQFSIAERVAIEYRRRKIKGDKSTRGLPDRETASLMFRAILANGLQTVSAPRAQYRLAVALDEEGGFIDSVREFNTFLENYPDHPLADDAAFQVAFIDYRFARQNNYERSARERARLAFEYFLSRFPGSEKVPEARYLLGALSGWEGDKLIEAGEFYEKTGKKEAAARSYREAMQSNPEAPKAESVKKRLKGLDGSNAATPPPSR